MIHRFNHYLIQALDMGPKNRENWQNANYVKIAKFYILDCCHGLFATVLKKTISMLTQSNI